MDIQEAMKNSPAVKKAIAFREAQLADNPTKTQLKKAGIDPDAKRAEEVSTPVSDIVFTNNAADLPPGSSGRVVTEGVFEVFRTTDNAPSIPKAVVVDEVPVVEAPSPAPAVAEPVSSDKKASEK